MLGFSTLEAVVTVPALPCVSVSTTMRVPKATGLLMSGGSSANFAVLDLLDNVSVLSNSSNEQNVQAHPSCSCHNSS